MDCVRSRGMPGGPKGRYLHQIYVAGRLDPYYSDEILVRLVRYQIMFQSMQAAKQFDMKFDMMPNQALIT